MKNTILTTLLLIALASTSSQAQVGIGVAIANINASAQLDVVSTTKGFLPPRMTYGQRNAIVTPGAGLIIYCTDCGSNGGEPEFYNGVAWVSMYGLQGSLPTLAPTSSITAIGSVSASSGGAILTDGGATVYFRGLCWSTSSNPTIALSTKTVDGSGIGAFTSAITGLTNNTTYYVRSYATNAAGTAYGNELAFTLLPISSTLSISNLMATTADCGGNISAGGNETITARGVCWSTNSNPTIALSTKTVDGTGIGSFTSSITGLTQTTTYYVRSYATNVAGTAYGNEVVFTTLTLDVPTISTSAISNLTYSSAISGGNISADGNATVTARGVCWSTSSNPTIAMSTKTVDGTGIGTFTSAITGLTQTTTYYVRSYATNVAGTAYGNEVIFTTLTLSVPTISTSSMSNLLAATATCGGNISADGNATVTARGVCWSTSSNPTIALSTKTADGTGIGSFTSSITGLTQTTTYYIRSYATNAVGTAYGNEVVFTTPVLGTIGDQVWATQNLNVSSYRDGTPIPLVEDAATWASLTYGAYCYYNNDPANGEIYGKLYNWYAVNDSRGLAPAGYHIPTHAEWITLHQTLGGNTVAGGKMKEAGTSHWTTPNTGASNSSGFSFLPGGYRLESGEFGAIHDGGYSWCSTLYSATKGWFRFVVYYEEQLRYTGSLFIAGMSVRCIKD